MKNILRQVEDKLRWILAIILLVAVGMALMVMATKQEEKSRRGYQTHAAATAALEARDFETAYVLYLQSAAEFEDSELKALALYQAANIGWGGSIADYRTLVGLYQQAIRYKPGFYEASFNLEYLYWLKTNAPEELPQPDLGPVPSREEAPSSGDI